MSRNGSGVASYPAGTLGVPNTAIESAKYNAFVADAIDMLTDSINVDGTAPYQANQPMGGFKLTGLGSGSALTDSAALSQVQSGVVAHATTVGGTADAITLVMTPVTTVYTSKERFRWTSAGVNTITNPTINRDGIGAKTIKKGASAALAAGDTGASGYICEGIYNGTDVILQNPATQNVTLAGSNTWSGDQTFTGGVIIGGGPMLTPGGRLTITSATPVLTTDTTAQTTVYYALYTHNSIMLYDGTNWTKKNFTELSQTLADATKSPAAAAVSSNYDMFVWTDSGTLRCTRGPAWTSATARGTGAGTTELERVHGVWMNKVAITNGPGADRGVYVGTISTSSSGANGQLNMMFAPAAASGGGGPRLDVWNMYNRTRVASMSKDSDNTWTYTTGTWRAANAGVSSGVGNRITVVCGFNEDHIQAFATGVSSNNGSGVTRRSAVGLDSTSVFSGFPGGSNAGTNNISSQTGHFAGLVGLGSHFLQWLEYSDTGGTSTWIGDNGASVEQSGIAMTWVM